MGSFCKKTFFRPLLSPRKLNKASFTNALRPDCPSRKFPGQQNSSDNSEDSESAEETESTEDPEPGRASIPACLVECRPKGLRLPVDWGVQAATGILPCLHSVQAGRACAPFPSAPLNTAPACAPGTRRTSPIYAQGWASPHQRAAGRTTALFSLVYTGQGQPRRALSSSWVFAGNKKPSTKK